MYSSSVIFGVWLLCIANIGCCHCDIIDFQPGVSYSWIIPPQSQPIAPPAGRTSSDFDSRNEAPITHIGGYGHPPFYLRHSHEQLSLPNEFLVTPTDAQRDDRDGGRVLSHTPLFQQLDPNKLLMNQVDCDGDPTCTNVDITQQQQQQRQHPTTIHQSNIDSVPAITPPEYHQQRSSAPASLGQAVNWPSSHGGGIGLLFFVPESASRLPVEQLIRQQLALHRTQFPFDISINCEDAVGSGCRPGGGPSMPLPATTLNGRNAENGNYASPPLVGIIDSSSRRGSQQHQHQQQRKWRTIGESIVRNNQHHNRLQQQQIQQHQQLQQNQRELSILPQ